MAKKVPIKKPTGDKTPETDIVYKKQGWICPSCGGGVAPDVKRCPCKPINYPTPWFPDPIPWNPKTPPLYPPWNPLDNPRITD